MKPTTKRIVQALSVLCLSLLGAPRDAFALKQPLCPGITYNGSSNPTWFSVGGAAGKLVQRSDSGGSLYATGPIVY